MRKMPDRLWARRNQVHGGTMQPSWSEKPYAGAVPYVRADIAAELVAALELAYAVMPAPKHGTIGYARIKHACDAVTAAIAKAKRGKG